MQTCTSSNLQTPSSKEIPESKHQNPSSKHQRSSKLQIPSSKRGPRFGAWNLGLPWCLELGFWCLDSEVSSVWPSVCTLGASLREALPSVSYLFRVAQIFNLPYRR